MPKTAIKDTALGILKDFRRKVKESISLDDNIGLWVFKYYAETLSLKSWYIIPINIKDEDDLEFDHDKIIIRYGEGTIG